MGYPGINFTRTTCRYLSKSRLPPGRFGTHRRRSDRLTGNFGGVRTWMGGGGVEIRAPICYKPLRHTGRRVTGTGCAKLRPYEFPVVASDTTASVNLIRHGFCVAIRYEIIAHRHAPRATLVATPVGTLNAPDGCRKGLFTKYAARYCGRGNLAHPRMNTL